ncbi:homeodomain-interacting kinase 2 isoform X1 [Solea senegalensis]|uniref:Homeodomain-interacting kinase 2 isoform X1 n=1 Tax=Solea senegalensis TaxID=28829 RepID=A0AAV6QSS4_SOLSE|nr:homeodomain-interacting kinase 2 isoform X1 [Solea senegalensis]
MYFSISVDELIPSDSTHYEVQELLGRGTYGIVTKCRKTTTNEIVALKILRSPQCMEAAKKEVAFLKSMRNFNLDNFNILKLNTYFTFKGQLCLEFEKLDMNLKQFIENNHDQTLEMTVIRSIVQQMRWIVFTVGQPPVRVLDAGRYTAEFFKKNVLRPGTNQWTFASRGDETISADKGNMLSDLQTILQKAPYRVSDKDTFCEICERVSFADLVTKMLTVDAADRITPMQILQHPFITMDHLVDIFGCTPYVQSFIKQRRTFQGLSSDNEKDITVPSTYQSEDSSYITASSRGSDPSEGSSVWLSANEHFSPSDSIISEDKADDRKRRRDTDEDPHHDNTPERFQVKKRKRGSQKEVPAETRGEMIPDKSKGRKRIDAVLSTTTENNRPGWKGRRINKANSVPVNKQLENGVKKILRRSERIKCRLT